MTYEYTDQNGDTLNILPGVDDGDVWVEVGHHETGWVMSVAHDDAPAAALAILEAAGIEGWNYSDDRLASAVIALTEHKRQQDAKAERDAEDAKVQEFRESSMAAIAHVFKESNNDSKGWDGLSEEGREGWRARYRAARKFFEEEQ